MARTSLYARRRPVSKTGVAVVAVLIVAAGFGVQRFFARKDPAPALRSEAATSEPPAPAPVTTVPPVHGDLSEATAAAPLPLAAEAAAGGQDDYVEALVARVKSAEAAGDPDALRRLLGVAVLDPKVPAPVREPWFVRADELNRRLVFSASEAKGFGFVEVLRGDSYWKICERLRKERSLKTTPGLLDAINHVPSSRLKLGQRIKVPTEPFTLLVDKSDFGLYVLLGGVYALRFPIGIGREDLTPEGSFEIGGKVVKPTWTDPKTGKIYKFGEPGHLIGSRWMAFLKDGKKTGFGIHGTIAPESIGKAQSDGCVRLRNDDVERLYDLVPDGALVTVRD